ncbi:MAG: carboxymuconolactone decarboxylase family protein, partial [Microthrixaceae bacterium]
MGWTTGDPVALRALAPEPFEAFDVVLAALPAAAPPRLGELARRRIVMLLAGERDAVAPLAELADGDLVHLASWPTSLQFDAADRAVLELTEQFVIDVASITDEQRSRCLGDLGDHAFVAVQSVYVLDHGLRVRAALRQLFGVEHGAAQPSPGGSAAGAATPDLWTSLDEWMRSVARLRQLDPLTTELVRLRGARAHDCRLCRSLRNVRAVEGGADESTFDQVDDYESSSLSERHKVALRLTDAMLWQPTRFPDPLVDQVRAEFDPTEALELVLDVARNAANKIAVTFGADQANVAEGVEYYDVDELGDLVYGLTPDTGG